MPGECTTMHHRDSKHWLQKPEEAKELVDLKGCLVASDEIQLIDHLNELNNNEDYRLEIGNIAGSYIKNNLGATKIILNYIEHQLGDNS